MQDIIQAFLDQLLAGERYCEEEEITVLHNGTAAAICTNSAVLVAREFDGSVRGYGESAGGSLAPSGHDFAIVGNRYIVDYWAFTTGESDRAILDMDHPADRVLAAILYGNPDQWDTVDHINY